MRRNFCILKSSLCSTVLDITSGVRVSDRLAEAKPNIDQNLWVFAEDAYGLWVIADLWVMGHDFPQTNLVDKIFYGI